jgi:hypothetical protein
MGSELGMNRTSRRAHSFCFLISGLLETNDIENVRITDGTHEDHGNGEGQEARSSDDGWTLVRRGK